MLHIILAHGTEAEINSVLLKYGELAFSTDTFDILVGTPEGNKNITDIILGSHLASDPAHPAAQIGLAPVNGLVSFNVQGAIEELAANYITVGSDIITIQNDIVTINTTISSQADDISGLDTRLTNLEDEATVFSEELDNSVTRIGALETDVSNLTDSIASVEENITNNYVTKTETNSTILHDDTGVTITTTDINVNAQGIIQNTHASKKISFEHISNDLDNVKFIPYIDSNSAKQIALQKNKNTDPIESDNLLNKGEIETLVQNAIGNIDTGLDEPKLLDKESNLPVTGTKGENYFIQDMDITSPGLTGRAWWSDTDNTWEKIFYAAGIATPDNTTITINSSGLLTISPDLVTLIDNSEQGANKTTSVAAAASASDVKYPTEKAVRTAIDSVAVADGSITTAKLADGAVTAAKIPAGAVGSTQLAVNSVNNNMIADNTINGAKLVNGSIQNSKYGLSSVGLAQLQDTAVGTGKLANNAVTNAKLATMAANTLKGNATAAATIPQDLTVAQVKAMLGINSAVSNSVIIATSGTWTVPSNITRIRITCVGGGGGGGGGYPSSLSVGGNGGCGGVAVAINPAGIAGGTVLSIIIGAGGSGGTQRGTGGTGGTTSVTNFCSAPGGNGGTGGGYNEAGSFNGAVGLGNFNPYIGIYGNRGLGGVYDVGAAGTQGCVIIEY